MSHLFASAAVLALVAAGPALAQSAATQPAPQIADTASPPAKAQDNDDKAAPGSPQNTQPGAGDIIVTARKRAESVRDVPGTITAVTNATLLARGPITGTTDLLSAVPGVRFNNVASANLSEISIRGSGTERATGADSGVGLFVNGAYIGSSTLGGRNFKTIDYFDLDRVEVQEGPQGALYGRNSEYGVVNLILAAPKFEDSGTVSDTYTGGLDQNRVSAILNRKISDDVAFRIGAEDYTQSKGFYYDPANNRYYDTTSGWTARAQMRVRSGPLDVNFLVDGQDLRLPSFVNSFVLAPGINAALPLGYMQPRFDIPHTGDDDLRQKQQRAMLTASYDLGWATINSTSMISHWSSQQAYAATVGLSTEAQLRQMGELGAYPFGQVRTDVRDRSIYQDLRLSGNAAGGRLSWLVGGDGLFQHDKYGLDVATSPCAFTLNAGICGGTPTQPICFLPLPTSTPCPTPTANYGTDTFTRQTTSSIAAYASIKYTLGRLTLDAEGRYTHDHKTATQTVDALYTTTLINKPSDFAFSASKPTWAFTASYKLPNLDRTMFYTKIGSGYRAGGVNIGTYNANAPNPLVFSYGDETTTSYEIGTKTNIGSAIFFTLDGYISRTHNAITSITDGCAVTNACGTGSTNFNVNGGTVGAKGAEAALNAKYTVAAGLLTLGLNGSYQHADFVHVEAGSSLPILHSQVAQIPKWVMSANVDYRHKLTEDLTGFVNMLYSGQRGGVQDTVTVATPPLSLSNFDQFSLSGGVDYKHFEASVWVKNLTNETIALLKFQANNALLSVRYNEPRTIGGTITYHF